MGWSIFLMSAFLAADVDGSTDGEALEKGVMTERKSREKDIVMVASMPKRAIVASTITLRIKIQNESTTDAEFITRDKYWDFDLKVVDAKGMAVPLSRFGKIVYSDARNIGSSLEKSLGPGKALEVSLNLARVFDLSIQGEYTLSVSRNIGGAKLKVSGMKFELANEEMTGQSRQDDTPVRMEKAVLGVGVLTGSVPARTAAGQTVALKLELKNTSKESVRLSNHALDTFSFEVHTKDGKSVPRTLFWKLATNPLAGGSVMLLTLQPGKKATVTIPLSRFIDLTVPGRYTAKIEAVLNLIRTQKPKSWLLISYRSRLENRQSGDFRSKSDWLPRN